MTDKHLNNCVGLHEEYISWLSFIDNNARLIETRQDWEWYESGDMRIFVSPNGSVFPFIPKLPIVSGNHSPFYILKLPEEFFNKVWLDCISLGKLIYDENVVPIEVHDISIIFKLLDHVLGV